MTNRSESPFQSWETFNTRPKKVTHPFWLVWNVVTWILLISLTIIFFWGMGTLFFNRWINTGQVVASIDGKSVQTYTGGVFFEIIAGYETKLSFKRHIFHINEGNLFEYDYYSVTNFEEAWYYSRSPFYTILVMPTSWFLTQTAKLFKWEANKLGTNSNLTAMILAVFVTTLLLRLITSVGFFQQQRNKNKMEMLKAQSEAIKEKHKGNDSFEAQQKMQWEIAALYRRENVSPLSGALQGFAFAPFLFAMFVVVRNSRILKDSGTEDFSFTTSLWEQIKTGVGIYFIPAAIYLVIFAINNFLLPRILVFPPKDPNEVLLKKKQSSGGMLQWVFRILFIVIFFIVPVGTSIYWIFSTFFEVIQKIIAYFLERRDRYYRPLNKRTTADQLWNLKQNQSLT